MPKEIDLPDGSVGVFPDDMPDAEIQAALRKQFPPGAGERFVAGLKSTTVDPLVAMAKPPDLSTGRGLVETAFGPGGRLLTHMFDKARDAVKAGQEGNWKEAAASGLEAIPVVGQVAETLSTVGVPLSQGDVAGAAGAATGLAATAMLPAAARGLGRGATAVKGAAQSVASPLKVAKGVVQVMRASSSPAGAFSLADGIRNIRAGMAKTVPAAEAKAIPPGRALAPGTWTGAPEATVTPATPPPPPFSGNPSEPTPVVSRGTTARPATAPPARPAPPPPSPVAEEPAAPPAQPEAQAAPSEAKPPAVEPDLEAQLRESIANVLQKKGVAEAFDQPAMKEAMAAKAVKAKAIGESMETGARTLKAEQYGKLLKERGITATQAARLPKDSPFWATAAEELRNSMINSGELTWEQAERMKFKPPSARTVGQIVKMLDQ